MSDTLTTYIDIVDLRLRGRHGVFDQERAVGNQFAVTARLYFPCHDAMADDDLGATVSYADIVDIIKREMDIPSRLIEHVAGRIRAAIVAAHPCIRAGRITVAKLVPPIPAHMERVAFTVEWSD